MVYGPFSAVGVVAVIGVLDGADGDHNNYHHYHHTTNVFFMHLLCTGIVLSTWQAFTHSIFTIFLLGNY